VREKQARLADRPKIRLANGEIQGAYLAESFDPLPGRQTELLAQWEDGSAAIVRSTFGRGQTILVGSFLGLAAQQTRDPGTIGLIRNLAASVPATPASQPTTAASQPATEGWGWPLQVEQDPKADAPIEARLRTTADGCLLFAFNHSPAVRKSVFTFTTPQPGPCTVRDLFTGAELQAQSEGGHTSLLLEFNGRDVAVLHVRPGK
jgi:beta-galactosidase